MLLINASNITRGGGVNVLNQILQEADKMGLSYILISPDNGVKSLAIKTIKVPKNKLRFIYKIYLFFSVRFILKKHNISRILSVGNIALPNKNKSIKQTLIIQNAYAIVDSKDKIWNRFNRSEVLYLKLMNYLINSSIRYADKIVVQTEYMKKNIVSKHNCPVYVIPNYYDLPIKSNTLNIESNTLRLIYLSGYYPHKNFEIFIGLGQRLEALGLDISITLTLPMNRNTTEILPKILYKNFITNIGPVKTNEIPNLYQYNDGIISPSLLESFSGNIYEALVYKKIMFLSNLEFNTSLVGENGYYFDPYSQESLLEKIREYFKTPRVIKASDYEKILNKHSSNYKSILNSELK